MRAGKDDEYSVESDTPLSAPPMKVEYKPYLGVDDRVSLTEYIASRVKADNLLLLRCRTYTHKERPTKGIRALANSMAGPMKPILFLAQPKKHQCQRHNFTSGRASCRNDLLSSSNSNSNNNSSSSSNGRRLPRAKLLLAVDREATRHLTQRLVVPNPYTTAHTLPLDTHPIHNLHRLPSRTMAHLPLQTIRPRATRPRNTYSKDRNSRRLVPDSPSQRIWCNRNTRRHRISTVPGRHQDTSRGIRLGKSTLSGMCRDSRVALRAVRPVDLLM